MKIPDSMVQLALEAFEATPAHEPTEGAVRRALEAVFADAEVETRVVSRHPAAIEFGWPDETATIRTARWVERD